MSDGKDLKGFNETKPSAAGPWVGAVNTGTEPAAAFPSTDKSTQDSAGLGSGGK